MTITFKANEPMTGTPADSRALPAPPDVLTALLFDFNADSLTGATGTTANTLASSAGSATGLTLNTNGSSNFPSVGTGPTGHKALSFDGVNDWIRTPDNAIAQNTPATYAMLVYVGTGLTGTGRILTGASTAYHGVRVDNATGIVRIGVNADYQLTGGTITLGGWSVIFATFNGASSLIQVNRATPTTGTTTAGVIMPRVMLGTNTGATGTWFNGKIARLTAWNRALSDVDRAKFVDDLNVTYGLTI